MRFQDTIAFAGMMVFIEYVIYWIYPILGGGMYWIAAMAISRYSQNVNNYFVDSIR